MYSLEKLSRKKTRKESGTIYLEMSSSLPTKVEYVEDLPLYIKFECHLLRYKYESIISDTFCDLTNLKMFTPSFSISKLKPLPQQLEILSHLQKLETKV